MDSNNTTMDTNNAGDNTGKIPVPPISQEEYEEDKKNLPREDFIDQLMHSSGISQKEAEETANEIYGRS